MASAGRGGASEGVTVAAHAGRFRACRCWLPGLGGVALAIELTVARFGSLGLDGIEAG